MPVNVNPISIHAPQWGATIQFQTLGLAVANFNPRTPVGCDMEVSLVSWPAYQFQSTHPSGVRRGAVGHERGHEREHFNPRTPVGCDLSLDKLISPMDLFQSTHPSGVRLYQHHGYH